MPQRPSQSLTVTDTEPLGPGMVRVRFAAQDRASFAGVFGGSRFTDRYVKLVLPTGGGDAADPDDTVVRTYTAVDPDVEAGTLVIDFVVHGTDGVAGPWAAAARPGDRLEVRGPGGAYAPDPEADWHLLAGDESALPALRAAVEALPADAVGAVVVEVPDPAHEQELRAPAGVTVEWVVGGSDPHHALDDASGRASALEVAVRAVPWREGRVQCFVHGEANVVMHGIRPYLLRERGVPRADASVSGYWRRGRTEESFRVWKQELAAAESAG